MPDKKLTSEQIEEIKNLKKKIESEGGKFVYSQVARQYGVSGPTIRRCVSPNENDKKPYIYNPKKEKNNTKNFRQYQLKLYKSNKEHQLIINKMDTVDNQQKYLRGLILKDINQSKE